MYKKSLIPTTKYLLLTFKFEVKNQNAWHSWNAVDVQVPY